jgi:hypothetical protein
LVVVVVVVVGEPLIPTVREKVAVVVADMLIIFLLDYLTQPV